MICVAAFVALMPATVTGHAFIYYPPMRGGTEGTEANSYCPHCLGSTQLPMPTCGNAAFLAWKTGPVTTLIAGTQVQMEIRVTAHHMGHFMFRLCDRMLNEQSGGLATEESCLNQHILDRVRPEEVHDDCQPNDRRGDCQLYDEANPGYWYLPPPATDASLLQGGAGLAASAIYKIHYWVPAGVACEKCTLQWWWMSSNSGSPHVDAYNCYFQKIERLGWHASEWCHGACTFNGACPTQQGPYRNVGEQFKNCADVKVVDAEKFVPTSAPAATPSASPTPSPAVVSPRRRRAQAPPEPEPEPEPQPDAQLGAATCVAAAGMNNGVIDADCSKCATGYEWWPCNFENYCTCSPSCTWDGVWDHKFWTCEGSLSQVQSARHLRAAKNHRSLTSGHVLIQGVVSGDSTDSHHKDIAEEL